MSCPAERLAHLNPKPAKIDALPGGGVFGECEQIDIAHATAGMPPQQSAVLRLLYVDSDDKACKGRVHAWLVRNDSSQVTSARLATAVMLEFFGDATCRRCKGNGYTRDLKPCTKCDASGRVKWSDGRRRAAVGTNGVQWRKYRDRYLDMLGLLINAEHSALAKFANKLRNDTDVT